MNWCALAIASQLSRVGARRARGASTIEWRRGYWAKPMDFGPSARASILQAVDEMCHAGSTRPKGQNVVIPQWCGGDKDGLCVVKSENVENLSARLVKQVALVSGDGELEIMGMTVRAMEKVVSDGFITVADPKTSQDEYEGVKAMNLDKGYTPAALITNPMLQKGELENAALSRKYMRNRIWGLQSVLPDLEVGTRHNSFFTRQFCAGARQAALKKLRNSVPERSLVRPLRKKAGRNHSGQITIRHRGGGHKRAYRLIDFRRQDKDGVGATVAGIEYDPNRTARIALLNYSDGVKSYILAARGLVAGDEVAAGPEAEIRPGNALPLSSIPVGTTVHAIELRPGGGAQLARSAGSGAQLMRKEGKLAQLRLPSSEVRNVDIRCRATIGEVGFAERSNIKWRKAGQRRWLGWRPTVRGVAMNPVDHPHGGGEGRTSGGRHPVNPQGKAEGRTRRPKASDALIVRRRKAKK